MDKSITRVVCAFVSIIAIAQTFSFFYHPVPKLFVSAPTEAQILQEIQDEKNQRKYVHEVLEADDVYRDFKCDHWLAERTAAYALKNSVSARLVAATVVTESSCRVDVVSDKGAVGLMQVEPYTAHISADQLHNPDLNLDYGTRILHSYISSYGLREGLHHYNGMGDPSNDYADHIIALTHHKK